MNYYKILNLEDCADIDEVKKAYRKLSLQHHPDNFINDSIEVQNYHKSIQQQLNEAWMVLSNPEKKMEYDDSLKIKSSFNFEHSLENDLYSSLFNDLANNMKDFIYKEQMEKEGREKNRQLYKYEEELRDREIRIRVDSFERIRVLEKERDKCSDKYSELNIKIIGLEQAIKYKKEELNTLINRKIYKLMPLRFQTVENVLRSDIQRMEVEKEEVLKNREIENDNIKHLNDEIFTYEQKQIDNDPEILKLRSLIEQLQNELNNQRMR